MSGGDDFVEVECDILGMTDRAAFIFDGDTEVWIPLSLLNLDTLPEYEGYRINGVTIEVKEWKAVEEGLV